MPQTDLMGFPSTIFFLLLTFLGGYVVFVSYFLPQILLLTKVRNFINDLTLSSDLNLVSSSKIDLSVSNEAKFIDNLKKYSFLPVIFYTLEDVLLAMNFLNLVILLYFVTRNLVSTDQTLLVKPLTDLKLSVYKLEDSIINYELLGKNLRNDISKPLLFQYSVWLKNRENLFFKPVASILFKITKDILEEQRLIFQFEKNKRIYSQFKQLTSDLKQSL